MLDKNARHKVGYWEHQRSGCLWYRIKNPMDVLKKNGVETQLISIEDDVVLDEIMSFMFYGAYPFSFEKVLKHFKNEGIKIVYDMDDALELVDETNPFYFAVKKDVGSVQEILDYADEVTVSTPHFIDFLKDKTKAKITVVPNCYVPEEWTFNKPKREGIRIGFAGAAPHVPDLIDIIPVIKELQSKYDVRFLIMGFGQEDYETWVKQYRFIAQPEATKKLRELDALLAEIQFEWVPFVDFSQYPDTLTNLALDIGICPLQPTPFNNYRSASKAIEYNLAGALVLASDTIPYRAEPTSVLVKQGDWLKTLEYYINNPQEAKETHEKHLQWIKDNRNINTQIDVLKSVYVV